MTAPAREAEALERTTGAPAHMPWWRNRSILVPAASGLTLAAGLVLEWFVPGTDTLAHALFWSALLLGASQFAPGALKGLLTRGRLGIGLLMTISATGAVILGFIEEAAALAFLYSIVEALEDAAMDRARSGLRSLLALIPAHAPVLKARSAPGDGAAWPGGGGVDGQDREGQDREGHDQSERPDRSEGSDPPGRSEGPERPIRAGERPVQVPVEDLAIGDMLRLGAGERLVTDGVVRSGRSSLDVSAITGESIPVEVGPGDEVLAGSINTTGVLDVEATAPGTDNSLTTVVGLVEQAQAKKGEQARLADRLARPLVPGVLVLAAVVALAGVTLGDPSLWVERALVVLVAASPCALAIAVPITVVSGIGAGTKFGVVIKSGAAFERLGAIRHLAVDKTGTLTRNHPAVTEVLTVPGVSRSEVLGWAGALERHSTHPLARAITAAATAAAPAAAPSTAAAPAASPPTGAPPAAAPPTGAAPTGAPPTGAPPAAAVPSIVDAHQVAESPGKGISGIIAGAPVMVGSPRWLDPGELADRVAALEDRGVTVVVLHRHHEPAGAIGVRDELRFETAPVIASLRSRPVGITMLTGDNTRNATALAAEAGITDVRSQLHPPDKARAVVELRDSGHGPVAMIGDGINDAPALAAADIGIAMGAAGSDAALEAADVAFTGDDLRLIPRALDHARRGRRIINQNIGLSLAIITVLLPLAITGVLGLAAVVLIHELAEVVVILNGMRAARAARAQHTTKTSAAHHHERAVDPYHEHAVDPLA